MCAIIEDEIKLGKYLSVCLLSFQSIHVLMGVKRSKFNFLKSFNTDNSFTVSFLPTFYAAIEWIKKGIFSGFLILVKK